MKSLRSIVFNLFRGVSSGNRGSFNSAVAPQEDQEALAEQLIDAAQRNDLAEIRKLQKGGVDFSYRSDNRRAKRGSSLEERASIVLPDVGTQALVAALDYGSFDAAIHLIESGVDVTCLHYGSKWWPTKALDHVVDEYDKPNHEWRAINSAKPIEMPPDQKDDPQDTFTPMQRVRLFRAMVKNVQKKDENPLDLVSDKTFLHAIEFGRVEMIPELIGIGVTIENHHFVRAGYTYHRPHMTVPMLEALIPYVDDVNVTDGSGKNAGHEAAGSLHLEAFQWLEEHGLERVAVATKLNVPTYTHLVASRQDEDKPGARVEFANYLVEKKYDIDHPGTGWWPRTPTDVALDEGHTNVAVIYLHAGAKITAHYLAKAIKASHSGSTTTDQIKDLIDWYDAKELLTDETIYTTVEAIEKWKALNPEKNSPILNPVFNFLEEKQPERTRVAMVAVRLARASGRESGPVYIAPTAPSVC